MGTSLHLQNDEWRLALCPEFGGSVLSLTWRGIDVLRPARSIEAVRRDPREAAHYPCVPWFNRLYGGFSCEGTYWPLNPILDPVAALHGEGWINPWRVVRSYPNEALLEFGHTGGAPGRFPFSFVAQQHFALRGGAFSLEIRVRNEHSAPAPFGLGLHPFFIRTPETQIQFGADQLFVSRQGAVVLDAIPPGWRFNAAKVLPEETIDHSFAGFDGAALILRPQLKLQLKSAARRLHVFAPAGEDFFCLEAVTDAPGEFGRTVLRPRETLALSFELSA